MNEIPTVIRSYISGLQSHNVEQIAQAVADDLAFVTVSRSLNKDQFLQMLRALYAGFPDWHYHHDEPRWEEDVIAVKWRQGGRAPPPAAVGRRARPAAPGSTSGSPSRQRNGRWASNRPSEPVSSSGSALSLV
jgi:hypothetical protein